MAEITQPQEGDQWEHGGKTIEVHCVKDGNVYFGEVGALYWGDWMSMEGFLSELERTGAVRVNMESNNGNLTEAQKAAIMDVCRNLINTGIAFCHQPHLVEPEYMPQRGLAEIVRIVEEENHA